MLEQITMSQQLCQAQHLVEIYVSALKLQDNDRLADKFIRIVSYSPSNPSVNQNQMLTGVQNATLFGAALSATLMAMRLARKAKLQRVLIICDQQHVERGLNTWIHRWLKNGFLNADKKPVAFSETWKCIHEERALFQFCDFEHKPLPQSGALRDILTAQVEIPSVVNSRLFSTSSRITQELDKTPDATNDNITVTHDGYIECYTDGACLNNGKGSKAVGGIGVFFGVNNSNNISEALSTELQTNNRAEIMAAVRALEKIKTMGYKKAIIKTDSKFMIQCMTEWICGWRKNGWLTSARKPVKNKDELVQLSEAMDDMEVKFIKVAAHSGVLGNEEADRLAAAGVKKSALYNESVQSAANVSYYPKSRRKRALNSDGASSEAVNAAGLNSSSYVKPVQNKQEQKGFTEGFEEKILVTVRGAVSEAMKNVTSHVGTSQGVEVKKKTSKWKRKRLN